LRREVLTQLRKAVSRTERRIAAIGGDLGRIDEAEGWSARAQWLVAAAAKAPRGARSLVVSDWSTGEEQKVELPLDPSKPAREQVEAVFKRARRLRQGRPVADKRLAEAKEATRVLEELLAEADASDDDEALIAIAKRALLAAPRELVVLARLLADPGAIEEAAERGKRPKLQQRKPPYRSFVGSGDVAILVGRGAKQNDELTLDVARPHHWWLHAKGSPGAHVVVKVDKGKDLSPDQLVDAALLAAHFSDLRGETIVEITYVQRRYVRKPRKSPPGSVMDDRERVLVLRVDAERLARLLATETGDLS
jgi:predicted ribosome quality control (RQC) complex YloA/Tae2 family protein